jgi:Zn-dependent M16 (insulinase) family peptidase
MYPFSTENNTDYHNLMNVYLDAVFNPNLNLLDFRQEGWRLEHTDPHNTSTPIIYKGVVYNEMTGALVYFSIHTNLKYSLILEIYSVLDYNNTCSQTLRTLLLVAVILQISQI